MVDPNTRTGKRTPVTLKIKFKSETLEQFIERYAVDVSQGGIFIRTKEPLAVGTQMKFEFQLRDASPLIGGEGTVVWTRENDPSRPAIAPGMGVRFDRLAEGSQSVLERILSEKAKQAPSRSQKDTTKPPNMFMDTPTKVAPAPVQEALLGRSPTGTRRRADSEQTPLPKPMPFHSDADEFPEEAFEEQTKVRSLDELVAQTAERSDGENTATAILPLPSSMPTDELAARRSNRADSTLADPPTTEIAVPPRVVDRDSAPGLPSPPEPTGRQAKLLDTSPSPRIEMPGPVIEANKTRLGLEPAKSPARTTGSSSVPPMNTPLPMPSIKDAPTRPSGMQAVPPRDTPSKLPPVRRASNAPMFIGIVFGIAVIGAAVWFFVFREAATEEVTTTTKHGLTPGSDVTPGSNAVDNGSAAVVAPDKGSGSAVAMVGSNGSASAPKANLVDTTINSNVDKATIEIVDTDQTGPAPFKAKLEKDRAYKARVKAPGYLAVDVDVKGGQAPLTAKLVAKPHLVTVTSTPTGALIFLDGNATGHSTPFDIELKGSPKKVHVTLRKSGYRPVDETADVTYVEDDTRFIATLDRKLTVAPVVIAPRPRPPVTNNGSGSATPETGSATPPPDNDGGSAAPPPPPPPPPPSGPHDDTPGTTPSKGSGSAEPEPDWSKRN